MREGNKGKDKEQIGGEDKEGKRRKRPVTEENEQENLVAPSL